MLVISHYGLELHPEQSCQSLQSQHIPRRITLHQGKVL
jgi:hypothetical protein